MASTYHKLAYSIVMEVIFFTFHRNTGNHPIVMYMRDKGIAYFIDVSEVCGLRGSVVICIIYCIYMREVHSQDFSFLF